MIGYILFSCIVVAIQAQYPYSHQGYGSGQPQNHQQYNQQQQYGAPQQQYRSQQQQYSPPQQYTPPQTSQAHRFNPASVHYVNIGTQLQGDYKFGYDTGKGNDGQSFREETRLPDGSVKGAYGYVDATGRQRIIRYSAGKGGFVAEGDDIPKPPPVPASHQQPQQQPQQAYNQQSYTPQQSYGHQAPQQYYNPQPQQSYNQGQSYNNYQGQASENRPTYMDTSLFSYNIGGHQS